jgi:drug/metabolite transporter (DMT)-like permease
MSNNRGRRSYFAGIVILLITAFIWGFAFVAQRQGAELIDSISFSSLRFVIASFVLGLTVLIGDVIRKKTGFQVKKFNRDTIIGGIICGVILFVSTLVQQIGIERTTSAGKAGFITTLYIVMVPILGILARRRTSLGKGFAILMALVGFIIMCVGDDFTLGEGDGLLLLSAVTFGFHIVFIDIYCKSADPAKFTFVQFLVSAIIGIPFMAVNGFPTVQAIESAIIPLLYVGIFSSGIAYTLQVAGQRRVHSSTATLIMSLESVIALLGGVVILKEQATTEELVGCLLVFVAVFIAQIEIPVRFIMFRQRKYFVE